jgi:hypothetical protein
MRGFVRKRVDFQRGVVMAVTRSAAPILHHSTSLAAAARLRVPQRSMGLPTGEP